MSRRKSACLLFVIMALQSSASGSEADLTAIGNRLRSLPAAEIHRSDLPAELAEAIIEHLRSDNASRVLLRLNDQPTIDRLVEYVRKTGQDPTAGDNTGRYGTYLPQTLPSCQSPYILDDLAELLYEGQRLLEGKVGNERIQPIEYQHFVAQLIAGVVTRVPEFSEEVRESAKSYNMWGANEAVIAWYEANREALLAERFREVKPFPPPKPIPPILPPEPVAEQTTSTPPEPPPPVAQASAPAPETPPPPTPPASRLPWLLAALAGLLIGAGLWLRKRRGP